MSNFILPKWPELRVIGKNVTPEQAMEIIIRTDDSSIDPSSNDDEWCNIVAKTLGIPARLNDEPYNVFLQKTEKYISSIRWIKDLYYIRPSRITSHYIGGSKGWIDWDGTIGTCGHNIGKWPSDEEVLKEWKIIAKEFPFLSLRAQLFSKEGCEEGGEPVVEYNIENGEANMSAPKDVILPTSQRDIEKEATNFSLERERYCSIEMLENAIDIVLKRVPK
jgi:hypothetical protein